MWKSKQSYITWIKNHKFLFFSGLFIPIVAIVISSVPAYWSMLQSATINNAHAADESKYISNGRDQINGAGTVNIFNQEPNERRSPSSATTPIDWNTTGTIVDGRHGQEFHFECPPKGESK